MTVAQQVALRGTDGERLAKSRDFCREVTRREAKNFYYGLKLLPEPKRSAMYALYAYMRLVDDIADDDAGERAVEERRAELDRWEAMTRETVSEGRMPAGVDGEIGGGLIWPAFVEMVAQYRVPLKVFEEMIAGQRRDLEGVAAMADFAALYEYCYQVASVVGVASLYVWGFEGGEETLKLGVARGVAFQLTNILRDLREDASPPRLRCYLPSDEMGRFGVTVEGIARGENSEGFMEMMRFQVARAEGFYKESAALEGRVAADSRATLVAMTGIYHGLLEKIGADPGGVLRRRVRLSAWRKMMIGWRAMRGR